MQCVYENANNDGRMIIRGFAKSVDEAKLMINNIAKEYIIYEEGIKKMESVYVSDTVDLSLLTDGIYFVKDESVNKGVYVTVFRKKTNITSLPSWGGMSTYTTTECKRETIKLYGFAEFSKALLDNIIEPASTPSSESKYKIIVNDNKRATTSTDKNTEAKMIDMSLVIAELQKNKFKPNKTIKKEHNYATSGWCAVDKE